VHKLKNIASFIILFSAIFMPLFFVINNGFMNTYSNSIPKLSDLAIKNGHFNCENVVEPMGIGSELNLRAYYFIPYTLLAELSLITGVPPDDLKSLPIGLFIIILWWLLSRSLKTSPVFSALGALFLGLTIEIMPGLIEFSEFSLGFIFLFLVLLLLTPFVLKNRANENGNKTLLLLILLVVCAHFSYYTAEFLAILATCAAVVFARILKISSNRNLVYVIFAFLVILFLSPIVFDYASVFMIPSFTFSTQPRMGDYLLFLSNLLRAALIASFFMLFGVESIFRKTGEKIIVFLIFFLMIGFEYAIYSSSSQFNFLGVPRTAWLFCPLLAFLFLSEKWTKVRPRTFKRFSVPVKIRRLFIVCIVIAFFTASFSSFALRFDDSNLYVIPDIKHVEHLNPSAFFVSNYFSNNQIISGHDIAFLMFLRLDPDKASYINTFGRNVWDFENNTNRYFSPNSILVLSSAFATVEPISGARNTYVRAPSSSLFITLNVAPSTNLIYDDTHVRLYLVR